MNVQIVSRTRNPHHIAEFSSANKRVWNIDVPTFDIQWCLYLRAARLLTIHMQNQSHCSLPHTDTKGKLESHVENPIFPYQTDCVTNKMAVCSSHYFEGSPVIYWKLWLQPPHQNWILRSGNWHVFFSFIVLLKKKSNNKILLLCPCLKYCILWNICHLER